MQTRHSNTQLALIDSLTTTTESDLQEKAWHILALLLSIGNPTPAPDLASHCTLFNASPDLIKSLCSIPNSPITLTSNHDNSSDNFLVTISPLGLFALNQFLSNFNLIEAFATRIWHAICDLEVPLEDLVRMYFRKRKRIGFDYADVYDKDQEVCPLPKRIRNDCWKLPFHLTGDVSSSINVEPSYMLNQPNNFILSPDFFVKTLASELGCKLRNIEHVEDEMNTGAIVESKEDKRMMGCELDEDSALPIVMLDNEAVFQEAKVDEIDLESRIDINATCCLADVKWSKTFSFEFTSINGACNGTNDCHIETVRTETNEELLIDYGKMEGEGINHFQSTNTTFNVPQESNFRRMNELSSLDKEAITNHVKNQAKVSTTELCVPPKKLKDSKPSTKIRVTTGVAASPRQQALCQSLEQKKAVIPPKENQRRRKDHMKISMGQKSKQTCNDIHTKERKKNCALNSPKDRVGSKDFPCFDSYIVEEEGGSGGYGTVYRATRKLDGTTVAIKCPHENAHRHHVSNELRMLERFGGKNFVIKFEGCLKNQNSDCLVLEYVEHDRPEVLKKEIDIFQLRWYGYCMFRALASLHKQGVVHRDIKPGNFLFSCKANKGYLIDFNLALDLHQKLGTINKSKAANDVSFNSVAASNAKYVPPSKSRRFPGSKFLDAVDLGAIKDFKSTLEAKNVKKKAVRNIMISQGADGSGITSVKDATSARTPSVERMKEPLPSQVNPRLRIGAEDALKHEFFAPCNESLRRQKLLRQGHSLDSRTKTPSHGQSIARPIKISQRQP
ncbi:hypothetical protein D5086_001375 [Populus alba]|uniref:Uncharacterized protein n=1 Tax=Populus alba TaxID=43335 RepID=A0ACC4CYQ5_POPAL